MPENKEPEIPQEIWMLWVTHTYENGIPEPVSEGW